MSKKTKVITATNGDTSIRVTVEVNASGLVPEEKTAQIEAIASGVMKAITRAPYTGIRLSQIKVR